jgi:hypothetical protein
MLLHSQSLTFAVLDVFPEILLGQPAQRVLVGQATGVRIQRGGVDHAVVDQLQHLCNNPTGRMLIRAVPYAQWNVLQTLLVIMLVKIDNRE